MTCPACGATAPADARFCPTCGHALVARPDERRVVSVVFADLVGFTTYAEFNDPEHVKALVDECFEALSADVIAYGGQVDKIVGDALLALFGAPVAHEDDAERAVRCALRMQQTLATLRADRDLTVELRVGVNTGVVLVGALRTGGDYTAMGDVVNTASRLQTVADPGQVVVGPDTHAATDHAVQYEPLGALTVRGRSEPVDAWLAISAPVPPGTRRRARTPLVGRDPEVGLLQTIVDTALDRSRAHLVLLTGGAGVGKSRVASEVATYARDTRAAAVFEGQCVPYGEDIWWPIAETIRTVCRLPLHATHDDARERVYAVVAKASGRPADDPEVTRTGNGLLYLLGFAEAFHDVDPGRARDDALRSGQALFGRLADERPVVLVLSDLHWADDLVLELVDRLLGGLRSAPFVLVATARPELQDRWRPEPGRHNLSVLNLEPLDTTAVAALVEELLGADATPELTELLQERSGGNPFFVEELAALIRETGSGALGALVGGRLPATLQGLVTARLDTLDAGDRDTIEDCAVIGSAGPVDAVAALVAARQGSDPGSSLDRLADRELLELHDGEFRFPSEVVRDVAYGTLTKAERTRRHAVLADWLFTGLKEEDGSAAALERVAHHYGAAASLLRELGVVDGVAADLPDQALRLLEHAADRARNAELWPNASRLFAQALAILPVDAAPDVRWRLQIGRATALAEQREIPAARAAVDEILDDHPDPRTTARALTVLADILQRDGDPAGAIRTAERALDCWHELGDERGAADALRTRGITNMFLGNLDLAEDDIAAALTAFRDGGDRRGEAWALQNLASIAFFRGDSDSAEERLDRSAAMFRELGDYGGLHWCLGILAWTRFMQGRLDEAESLARDQLPDTEATGNRWVAGILTMLLANLALWRGDAEAAVTYARDTQARFDAINDQWGQTQARASLIRGLACVGRVGDSLDLLDRSDLDTGSDAAPLINHLIRAQVLIHIGDPDALAAALHVVGDEDGGAQLIGDAHLALGLALLQAGRVDEAVVQLRQAREQAAHDESGPGVAASAAFSLGAVVAGHVDDARALADTAAGRGTYLDQIQHGLASAFARLRADDPATVGAFDAVVAFADRTQSRLDQAVTRLARAHAWRALDHRDADDAAHEAQAHLDAIGITAAGWDRCFSLAAGA
ncbi:MAG TPA: adenylate/guanylate cyclase domain-containing protein [Acidimicrobiia bacterium]|nr:adenylate/guanylate cyclase domain-containing protein [Acidimicrobiia bacterium]